MAYPMKKASLHLVLLYLLSDVDKPTIWLETLSNAEFGAERLAVVFPYSPRVDSFLEREKKCFC